MQCHCRTKRDNLLHKLFGLRQKFCSDDLQAAVVGIAADAFHLTPVSDFHAAALTLCDFFRQLTMPQFFLYFSGRCHFFNSSGLYPFGVIIPHFYSAVEGLGWLALPNKTRADLYSVSAFFVGTVSTGTRKAFLLEIIVLTQVSAWR